MNVLKIGVTFSESRYENYPAWIRGNNEVEVIELSWEKENVEAVSTCDGILLTGGVDAHPRFYNGAIEYPNKPENWNEARDVFEQQVFLKALELNKPILAICRGLQLVNCALGGTLVQDLESAGKQDHRRNIALDADREHPVLVKKNSLLEKIANQHTGWVNSAHHQAIDSVSEKLMVNCYDAKEHIVEGIEWKEKENKPWFIGVQWHPERLETRDKNAFSLNIRAAFLEACKK